MIERDNERVARRLEEVASILEGQRANAYRVQAYRHAAESVRREPRSVAAILEREGEEGLRSVPGVGERLSRAIASMLRTGRLPMLERLRGESDPVALLASVGGIGPVTAERLHHDLGIDTLEDLETAAHDGRLATLAGLGRKRIASIEDSLSARLGRVRPGPSGASRLEEPPVSEILDVDREYRERARRNELPRIAPRRMNPHHEAWLPVLHTERGTRHYTALFSNTPRAHDLGRTRDWVVLYYDADGSGRQCTVITSERGPLRGRRIVRGREEECARLGRGAATSPCSLRR